jgi:uridylate kinase
MPFVIPYYTSRDAREALKEKKIVIVGGGTGQQFFTTDTGAATHALQTESEIVLKGTNVEGVYSADPKADPNAVKFDHLSFDEALNKRLNVMDMTAFALLRESEVPILVFDVQKSGNLKKAILGQEVGTLIS